MKIGSLVVHAENAAHSAASCLGACPSNRRGRVPGLAGADARRRDAGDVVAHRRGAPTKQMSLPGRNPKGAWGLHGDRFVARRQRCASTSPPPRALRSPCKPHACDPSYYSDRLLAVDCAADPSAMLKYDCNKQMFRRERPANGPLLACVSLGGFVNGVVHLQTDDHFVPMRLAVNHFAHKRNGSPLHFRERTHV